MKTLVLFSFSFLLLVGAGCASAPDKNKETDVVQKKTAQVENTQNNTENMEHDKDQKRTLPDHKDLAKEYTKARITTNHGDIVVEFFGEDSPITVNNFLNLAEKGFYDGVIFHRIIKDFMIQGGDPQGIGVGGPGYTFEDEFNDHSIVRGSLAMANAGPGTNGSQFFIVTAPATPHLDGRHTNFGTVVEGMDVVDVIEAVDTDPRDKPLEDVVIKSIVLVK
ncbi:MAG: peptidylprolyl isomerase [Candidatus Magasanikbacteria bacterium]|jgi:peptidyl-prolyl cis-trans isomerase B (cyclophilin B)|nr:peptidylprolyl isomerase [Candidatus Magasanikbacteria bacterium]